MTKKATIISFIVVVVIAAIGIYVWDSYALHKNDAPKPSENNTASQLSADLQDVASRVQAANIPATTVGWNVYEPKNIPLSFKSPSGLLIHDVAKGVNIYANTPENQAYIKDPEKYEGSRPGMYIAVVGQAQSPEAYAKQNFPELQNTNTKIFGEDAVVFAGQGMDPWDGILFKHGGDLYQVTIQYGSPTDEARATYYKILSSFAFN